MCFISPRHTLGLELQKTLDENHIQTKAMGDPIYTCEHV